MHQNAAKPISTNQEFQHFLGDMPPDPPSNSPLRASPQPSRLKFSRLWVTLGRLTKNLLRTLTSKCESGCFLPSPPPQKKKLAFSSALDDGTYMIKYDNQTIQSALTAVSMYGKGIFWNCVLFVLTVFSLFLPLPVVSIQSCFETSRFVTSLFIRGVKLFHALGLKNEDIHPKCFSCWLQTTLEVSKTFVQFHCLSLYRNNLYRNDFESKRSVSFLPSRVLVRIFMLCSVWLKMRLVLVLQDLMTY